MKNVELIKMWKETIDQMFPNRKNTITVAQLGELLDKKSITRIGEGIREGKYPGKATLDKKTGRFSYHIPKWNVAVWLAEGGMSVIG